MEDQIQNLVTRKNNFLSKYLHLLLAVVCTTAFFIHESIDDVPKSYSEVVNKYLSEKEKRTELLNIFKNKFEDSEEYRAYYQQKIITNEAFEELEEVSQNISFLGFEDFQQFIGEFGWALGLFLYALFNFINTYMEPNRSRKGKLFLHFTLITISLYFIYWALYQYQDFEKFTYLLFSIITSILIAFGVHLIQHKRYKLIKSYILNHRDLIGFILKNTKKESEPEMWKVLKNIKHERD
ncbi:hypothetical protein KORDIASMS9_02247 [Kordia sp. SMS9]|uniref:hypothetical protein n=1 Tax=Kordia sp. SMS9 TaxID=2282170 RepID=UPI000E10D34B|nr:hypothetical protein [Kordia sp. SMS9]AXG70018.1 hypothetical protein KORDIASMS9_02247 [Kordia sp. SMS9]